MFKHTSSLLGCKKIIKDINRLATGGVSNLLGCLFLRSQSGTAALYIFANKIKRTAGLKPFYLLVVVAMRYRKTFACTVGMVQHNS